MPRISVPTGRRLIHDDVIETARFLKGIIEWTVGTGGTPSPQIVKALANARAFELLQGGCSLAQIANDPAFWGEMKRRGWAVKGRPPISAPTRMFFYSGLTDEQQPLEDVRAILRATPPAQTTWIARNSDPSVEEAWALQTVTALAMWQEFLGLNRDQIDASTLDYVILKGRYYVVFIRHEEYAVLFVTDDLLGYRPPEK